MNNRALELVIRSSSWVIASFVAAKYVYPCCLIAARCLSAMATSIDPSRCAVADTSWILHRMLDKVSAQRSPFPIAMQIEGAELLQEAARLPGGVVCCGAHLPFVKLFVTAAREALGSEAEIAGAFRYPRKDGTELVWCDTPVRAIKTDGEFFLKTRSLLRRGGCLILLVDEERGQDISANIFKFIGRVGGRVTCIFPYLREDGVIVLKFIKAPGAACKDGGEIASNVSFITSQVERILRGGVPGGSVPLVSQTIDKVSVSAKLVPPSKEVPTDADRTWAQYGMQANVGVIELPLKGGSSASHSQPHSN